MAEPYISVFGLCPPYRFVTTPYETNIGSPDGTGRQHSHFALYRNFFWKLSQRPIELRELSKKGVGVGMLASRVHLDPVQNRRSHMILKILSPTAKDCDFKYLGRGLAVRNSIPNIGWNCTSQFAIEPQKCAENYLENMSLMIPKWFFGDAEMTPNISQSDPNKTPKSPQHDLKMTKKWL